MTPEQIKALSDLSDRYHVKFFQEWFKPTYDLPEGYVAGWIGGPQERKLYVGCDPDGRISS
jgi:hypothetical protein